MVSSATNSPVLLRKAVNMDETTKSAEILSLSPELKRKQKKYRGAKTLSITNLTKNNPMKFFVRSRSRGSSDNELDGDTTLAQDEKKSQLNMEPLQPQEFLQIYKKKLKEGNLNSELLALARTADGTMSTPLHSPKAAQSPAHPGYNISDYLADSTAPDCNNNNSNNNVCYIYSRQEKSHFRKEYIATQGPTQATINDFWRLIWEEGCDAVVMLTSLFIFSKTQCERYWHDTYNLYGDIHVKLLDQRSTCNYNIHRLLVAKAGGHGERLVTQFQFHCWVESECPNVYALLEFRRQIKKVLRHSRKPLLVHCSNGAGRTGTFIALDMVLNNLHADGYVNILQTVEYLKKSKQSMFSNVVHLKILYDAVAITINHGITAIPTYDIHKKIIGLSETNYSTKMNGFEKELKVLNDMMPKLSIGDCAGGHRGENRKKSRDIMIQPPERARPYLMTFDSSDSSDFINAVYLDGYQRSNEFIVSQWPLKTTICDFWRLVFDKQISCTVVLHNNKGHSKGFPEFWPSELRVRERYGPVCVTLTGSEETPNYKIKTFSVRKALYYDLSETPGNLTTISERETMMNPGEYNVPLNTRNMQMVFLKTWLEDRKMPQHSNVLIDLMNVTEHWKNSQGTARTPTLVISKNGISRVGVFCALAICLEQHKMDGEVDVFNAVRTVKQNRPQVVENATELQAVYEGLEYLTILHK